MAAAGVEPNAENKIFVGGCPPSSNEAELRELFEKHGAVEEVFVMRGGSRSGMACAFVRFSTQQSAQQAIDAIHGQHTLPEASEPLVVRWADAPGCRKRDGRDGSRKRGGQNGGRAFTMANNAAGFRGYQMQQMMMMMQQQQMAGMGGGGFSPPSFYPHQAGMQAGNGYGAAGTMPNMIGYQPMMTMMSPQGIPFVHSGFSSGPPSPQQQQHPTPMMMPAQPLQMPPAFMDAGPQMNYVAMASPTGGV